MKILVVHNLYQHRGGEGVVAQSEAQILAEHGHKVIRYQRKNDELTGKGLLASIRTGVEAVWSSRSYEEIKEILRREKPDIAHFHNTFPLISPSGYYACAEANTPVVQTLHNYRLLCPGANLLRDGAICESCIGRSAAWPGVVHRCYHGSIPQTAAVAAILAFHKARDTWQSKVDLYIAMSEFARRKFLQGGLPADRIVVKPNFVYPDIGPKRASGEFALFVGRLSEEKGLNVLIEAWSRLKRPIPLRVLGDGPMREELRLVTSSLRNVRIMGSVPRKKVLRYMHRARFLVAPSICFEAFPVSIVEAFSCALPVIASRIGSLEEIVENGHTGLQFSPARADDLASQVEWAWTHPQQLRQMGTAARAEFELKYAAEQNYLKLMQIYERARGGIAPVAVGTEAIEPSLADLTWINPNG